MSVAITIILFIAALFVAICLHELGHFMSMRRAGVKVEEFGIGLPPRLLGIKRGETIYSINAIPVGAFVRPAGEDDPAVPRGLAGKRPWTRLGIFVAGPLANILLAFVLLSAFYALPYLVITGNGIMVHSVEEESPAEGAGMRPGDIILRADGYAIQRPQDLRNRIDAVEEGTEMTFLVQRNTEEQQVRLTPTFDPAQGRRTIGVILSWNIITHVEEGSPADEAGIGHGDTLLRVNGAPVYNQQSLSKVLDAAREEHISVTLQRDGEVVSVSLDNRNYQDLPGVEIRWVPGTQSEEERRPVWSAIYAGASYIIFLPVLIVEAIPLIIESPDLAVVGPIGAGQLTVEAVDVLGFGGILFMAGLISLGIGLFNLLPIPPLDGGGMLVGFIEGIRRGRRLSRRAVRLAYTVGTALLIALIVVIFYLDIERLIAGRGFGL